MAALRPIRRRAAQVYFRPAVTRPMAEALAYRPDGQPPLESGPIPLPDLRGVGKSRAPVDRTLPRKMLPFPRNAVWLVWLA